MNFQNVPMSHQGVTSIEQSFKLRMEAFRNGYAETRRLKEESRFVLPFSLEQFKAMLAGCAAGIMAERNVYGQFIFDDHNTPVIEELYKYLRLDNGFHGDLNKGIMLVGKYGCGKTLILQSLMQVYNTVIRTMNVRKPIFEFQKSTHLQRILLAKGIECYAKRPLLIDELGREPKQVMDFGNEKSPLIELLCDRYDRGAWTMATSNFTLDTLSSDTHYGRMTGDRLSAMFNIVELKGNSKRIY